MPEAKVIVVTGAGNGIGKALALQAARRGYAVVAVSLLAAELNDLAKAISEEQGACVTLALDVTASDAPARIVQTARESFGRIDVLVNNAGMATAGALLEQTDAQIDQQWKVHVSAPLRITREALPLLRESRGQVMFVGSSLSRVPPPLYGAYCAAKAAVRAMATQLRRELHGTGIAVTFVDPGSVRTNFGKAAGIPSYDPEWTAVAPERVARKILDAVERRPIILHAVPVHAFIAMLGEWFPRATDRAMAQRTRSARRAAQPAPTPQPAPAPQPEPIAPQHSEFERARGPVSRRLERVKLPQTFLAQLLQPGSDVQLADAAMRWAGMPNKNERAAMSEALDALAAGGFLEKTGDESWRVVRSAD